MVLKKIKFSVLTMGISLMMLASVAYASPVAYNATLPGLKGDVTLRQGVKETGDDYITHSNILIGDGDNNQSMAVWVDKYENGTWSAICDYELHYEFQGPYTLYTNPTNVSDTIRVRADNADLTPYSYAVKGYIDLR